MGTQVLSPGRDLKFYLILHEHGSFDYEQSYGTFGHVLILVMALLLGHGTFASLFFMWVCLSKCGAPFGRFFLSFSRKPTFKPQPVLGGAIPILRQTCLGRSRFDPGAGR